MRLILSLLPALACLCACSGDSAPRATVPPLDTEPAVTALFHGDRLEGWRKIDDLIGGGGEVTMGGGVLTLGEGNPMNGIVIDSAAFSVPETSYEIEVEAMRVEGREIFCGLTFPVPGRAACVTFVAGGWGGRTTGISSIGGLDAAANSTMSLQPYENGRWYAFRLRVEPDYLQVWLDGRSVAAISTGRQQLGMRPGEVEQCQPLGFMTWETSAKLRNLRITVPAPRSD